jgi:hypothetical protein
MNSLGSTFGTGRIYQHRMLPLGGAKWAAELLFLNKK